MLPTRAEIATKPRATAPYSFAWHVALVHAGALALLVPAVALVREPSWTDLATAPAGFLFANLFEYLAHKHPMHHRVAIVGIAFDRHTMTHHAWFRPESMRVASNDEMKFVLFPWWAFLVMAALTSPVYLAVGLAAGRNAGLVMVAVATAYYLLYEWLHAIYRLAPPGPLARIPVLGAAAARHRLHHDPARMNDATFNITFPLFDHVFGTARLPVTALGPPPAPP